MTEYVGICNNPDFRSRAMEPYALTYPFSSEEFDKLISLMPSSLDELKKGEVGGQNPELTESRKSNIAWIWPKEDNYWIFERMNEVLNDINIRHYNFVLNGYESLQYTEYSSAYQGKYDWHSDIPVGGIPDKSFSEFRKLSFSIILTEQGEDFEGGNFEIMLNSKEPMVVPAKKGGVIIFPSFLMHRVAEVTKGKRKSLVGWVVGPKFR